MKWECAIPRFHLHGFSAFMSETPNGRVWDPSESEIPWSVLKPCVGSETPQAGETYWMGLPE